jgi:REP element-mobilizing transposase RayT
MPNQVWMVTRRCTQRQFLLRPDAETRNAFLYCLIEAAQKTSVDVVMAQMMSNHTHESPLPRDGNIVDFYQRFHTHLARCVNAIRGRWENMWSSEPTCLVETVGNDREKWIDQLVYIATNPVKAHLVDTVAHWPGSDFVMALLNKRSIRATRPALFREDGVMPEFVEMTPTIPPELGAPDEVIAELKRRIRLAEEECALERARLGRRVVGRATILRQSWRDNPTSFEARRNMRPRVAARSKWARIAAIQRNQAFEAEYKHARMQWIAGLPAVFPPGTFWLARHARVTVRSADLGVGTSVGGGAMVT